MNTDLNDIHAATHNLHQLLAVIYEEATDLYDGELDKHTRAVADRLSALAIIARDEAERVDTAVGEAIDAGNSDQRDEVAIVETLGEEYEEAHAEWNAIGAKADEPGAGKALKKAEAKAAKHHDMYRDAIFDFKPTTPAGFAAKASVLLRIRQRGRIGMSDDRVLQLLQSMGGEA